MPPVITPVPVHPVTGLTITNGQINVPALLQQPTRITTGLASILNDQLAMTNLMGLYFGGGGGGVSGGAVAYDKIPTTLDFGLPGLRQAEEIAPAAEYPLIGMVIAEEAFLAAVRKYGGKFYVTDEARDRNDTGLVALLTQFLAWTIQRKLNLAAAALVDAELVAAGMTATVSDWSAYDPLTMPASASPLADLNEIRLHAPVGVSYDTLVLSNVDAMILQNTVLNMGFVGQTLPGGAAIPTIVNLGEELPPGTGYYIDAGALGQVRYEAGLRTVTYRAEDTDRTWVQSGVRPVMFVNNPGAGVKLTIPGSDTWEGNVDFGNGFPLQAMLESESMNQLAGVAEPTEEQSAAEAEASVVEEVDDVPTGTIDSILTWVGNDADKADRALEKEREGQNRSSLITQLEAIKSAE